MRVLDQSRNCYISINVYLNLYILHFHLYHASAQYVCILTVRSLICEFHGNTNAHYMIMHLYAVKLVKEHVFAPLEMEGLIWG